jgi:hypothetical protein
VRADLTVRLLRVYTFLLRQLLRVAAITALALFAMAGIVAGLFVAYGVERLLFKPPGALIAILSSLGALLGGYYGWPAALWQSARLAEVRLGPLAMLRRTFAPKPLIVAERGNPAEFAALKARLQLIRGSEKYDGREQLLRDLRDGATWRYRYIEGDFYHDEEYVKLSSEEAAVALAVATAETPAPDAANKA